MMANDSLDESYFNNVYQRNEDPWGFESSSYEKQKYLATIGALTRKRYQNAFEIGCSIGVLTEMLAPGCARLLAVDISDLPLEKARQRVQKFSQVRIERMDVPKEFPDDVFDLIVLSETGYYWSAGDLQRARQLIAGHLEKEGQLLLVHWTPVVPDYPLTGDQVHDSFVRFTGDSFFFRSLASRREEKYRLDLLEKSA